MAHEDLKRYLMKKNTPLYSTLRDYKGLKYSSFHTPGHKNDKKFLKYKLFSLDYTELPCTDDLFEPTGPILQAEINAAEVFGTKKTLFSAGGCSLCIQTMLRLVCPSGGKVIVSRMIHKSAVNAMALLDIEPIWLIPETDLNTDFLKPIDPLVVKKTLEQNSGVKAVYLTSPDYYGVIQDIRGISEVCKFFGVPLIVDNAHGAHLGQLRQNLHPIYLGAAMSADSAHKTLPALTGGAFLHINDERYIERAKSAMGLFASTSPSFPIMASLDLCSFWAKKHGKDSFLALEKKVAKIKEIAQKKGLLIPQGKVDPTRLSFNTKNLGESGKTLLNHFRKFKIEPEFAVGDFIVLILTPFNSDLDFKRLKKAILALPDKISKRREKINKITYFQTPKVAITLRQALFANSVTTETENALGKVSKNLICPCPPGIPIVLPGEVITKPVMENLINYGILSLDVLK